MRAIIEMGYQKYALPADCPSFVLEVLAQAAPVQEVGFLTHPRYTLDTEPRTFRVVFVEDDRVETRGVPVAPTAPPPPAPEGAGDDIPF